MRDKNHYRYDYHCETCPLAFTTADDRNEHQEDEGHYKHLHCSDCGRYFPSANNLRQHMNSRTHRGTQIDCPFCTTSFVSASGLSHHLETSSCPNARNLNRQAIHRELRQRDPRGVITERLLEYHSLERKADWDPSSAFNGYKYECYLCHREFPQAQSLRQHITSPAHQEPLYHCPNKLGTCNGKRFPTLAALFNHLESESCGYVKFTTVQQNVNAFMTNGQQRLIAF
ncbi:C2H2 type zinc finger domain-containing protein 5 [Elsinoe australis]|uniref:C2H2 type zinc finger domain-containing protein 5 n=1 Tax=Elsinoe australis TaxID=40998 RepID=A0A4V6DUC3_9PEZI|nr:C2H2 type zinc finger domain-containing protein 5 [Elsinoe australis]